MNSTEKAKLHLEHSCKLITRAGCLVAVDYLEWKRQLNKRRWRNLLVSGV